MRAFVTYTDRTGHDPVNDFLARIPRKESDRVVRMLEKLADVERLGMPYLKQFAGYPFWFGELLIGDYRIFVHRLPARPGEERYLLVHGFRKKSVETPRREIALATRNVLDYYEQERENAAGAKG